MASPKRYIVEGTWSGYTSAQARCCHREVITRQVESYQAIGAIRFTDGTHLYLSVRPAAPRERVQEVHGYRDLLRRAVRQGLTGYVNVDAIAR
jgi:hypothetical protein